MLRFIVERVEGDRAILARENRSYQVPISLFPEPPKQGQDVLLSASIAPKDQRLPDPLARDVLNNLLTPNP